MQQFHSIVDFQNVPFVEKPVPPAMTTGRQPPGEHPVTVEQPGLGSIYLNGMKTKKASAQFLFFQEKMPLLTGYLHDRVFCVRHCPRTFLLLRSSTTLTLWPL